MEKKSLAAQAQELIRYAEQALQHTLSFGQRVDLILDRCPEVKDRRQAANLVAYLASRCESIPE